MKLERLSDITSGGQLLCGKKYALPIFGSL